MRDPQAAVDPRTVSAFSVYRGLVPNLTSYQDTSEGTSASRRKKARLRNKKSKSQQGQAKNEEKPELELAINGNASKSKKKQENSSVISKQNDQNGLGGNNAQSNGSVLPGEKKKKRKKRNKKSKTVEAVNGASSQSSLEMDSFLLASDDDDELDVDLIPPSKKSKPASTPKSDVVPNPFAKMFKISYNEHLVTPGGKNQLQKSQTSKSSASVNGKVSAANPKTSTAAKKAAGIPKPMVSDCSYKVESKAPPPDIKELFDPKGRVEDSVEHGKSVLDWMLHPVTSDEFSKKYWEKKPLLVKRLNAEARDFYKCILTTQKLDGILRKNNLKYGVNLDITNYVDGKRETLSENMQGRVRPAVVWDYYNNGCSLRMLNPQSYIQRLWRINSALQEWFGSFVGANMYLTPRDSQGFAPHYDDIEAFILQIEGKKQWKVYAPRDENEKLPRFSSGNFSEDSDDIGEPILDVILEEGDLLYFPRGYIHQAKTVDGEHSLHITVSCHQLNSYGDLLKHHISHALDKLMANDVEFRQGLPIDYLSYMGIAHENSKDKTIIKKREAFSRKVSGLVTKLAGETADFAADAMAKKFIWDSLPPFLSSKERETSVLEDGEFITEGRVFNRVEFGPEVKVKLARKHCVRLVVEEGMLKLYFSTENSLVYHEEEAQFLELSVEQAPIVNHLICQYPEYTKIEDLPISSNDIGEKIQVISDLWERGLIITKKPLEACDLDEDFDLDDSDGGEGEVNGEDLGSSVNSVNDDDDVESINLSDLPEDGEEGDSEDLSEDEFYDTSMMTADISDSQSSNDDEEEPNEFDGYADDQEFDFGEGGSTSEDEEDDEIGEEEEDEDEYDEVDEAEFDLMDGMEESDEEEDE